MQTTSLGRWNDEFLKAHYGLAVGPVGEYCRKAHDYVSQNNILLGIGFNRGNVFPLDVLKEYEQLFSHAISAGAHDPDQREVGRTVPGSVVV